MITERDIEQFMLLRDRLFAGITRELDDGGCCKSYDGRFAIVLPTYFEESDPVVQAWAIQLHCYAVGPNRHYEWRGKSFEACLKRASRDIDGWLTEQAKDAG